MKAIFFRLTLATLLPVFASCTNYYKSPSDDPTTHAVITNNIVVMGVARHETYRVYAVDGRPIDYFWIVVPPKKFFLTPGPHRIVVEASQCGVAKPPYYKNEIAVNVMVRAGGWYQPKGYVEGDNFVVWIEDKESGRDVSGKVRQRMTPVVQGSPAPLLPPPVML